MRIGISPFASTRDGSFAVADLAVEGGIDSLWLGEGLLIVDEFPRWSGGMEPFTWLAYLAGRYPGVRVGVGASVLPLRDIQWLAKQSSTLDNLTQGNHVLAVAPGFWEREFAFRGVDFARRGSLTDELLDGLIAAFEGQPHEGPGVSLPAGGRLSPEPFDGHRPELWLAGAGAMMRRAQRRGLPFQARAQTPEDVTAMHAEWIAAGGGQFALRAPIRVVENWDGQVPAHISGPVVAGSPDAVAERLAAYAAAGVDDLSIIPGNDDESSVETTRLLVREVLPRLAGLGVSLGENVRVS